MRVLPPEKAFLGYPEAPDPDTAAFVVDPMGLEMTTTYMQGTARGPGAILEASHQVEFYDDELEQETVRQGVLTLEPMEFRGDAVEQVVSGIEERAEQVLALGKKPVFLGGEHTITAGIVPAVAGREAGLSVLHLDAHADLRQSYEGSPWNHACVMARVAEQCPFVSVGIRSLCAEEAESIGRNGYTVWTMHGMRSHASWADEILGALTSTVYITLDLDALDPAVMPAVGTPEPGGMLWYETLGLLKRVFMEKRVCGVDVVELCPQGGAGHGAFTAAKLVYRIMGYWAAFSGRSRA